MPAHLAGSCHCGAIGFSLASQAPVPYQRCYCSICRKQQGGGGFAINLSGLARTLKVSGKENLGVYHATIWNDAHDHCEVSTGERNFCTQCGAALWLYDPEWPDLVHPFASAIDTPLPVPPSNVHLMLRYKAAWVTPQIGPEDDLFERYPDQSLEEWHRARDLWVE